MKMKPCPFCGMDPEEMVDSVGYSVAHKGGCYLESISFLYGEDLELWQKRSYEIPDDKVSGEVLILEDDLGFKEIVQEELKKLSKDKKALKVKTGLKTQIKTKARTNIYKPETLYLFNAYEGWYAKVVNEILVEHLDSKLIYQCNWKFQPMHPDHWDIVTKKRYDTARNTLEYEEEQL